jgi:hypothetical protein
MCQSATSEATWRVKLGRETATRALAREIMSFVGANDLVTLTGDLGAGKTTFARYLIRALLDDEALEVPSPTFTLMQVYEGPKFPIVHADLYRIAQPDELVELGWDEAADGALVLVEWIDRAGDRIPPDRLDIRFSLAPDLGPDVRIAEMVAHGTFKPRLARARAIHDLLKSTGWASAQRAFMLGDASTRAYERLRKGDETAVLMISPPRPDGPAIRDGLPYSALAHLAEDIKPFIAIGNGLSEMGYSAPRIIGADIANGLAVLEDLGGAGVVDDAGPIPERYMEATAALADLHRRALPTRLPLPNDETYAIPAYDMRAYLIEIELIVDWYALETPASMHDSVSRVRFLDMWKRALDQIDATQSTWTLRDYHSPNLIWLAARTGINRMGIIDFQDCVIGHPAYDLVSLLQDARVTVPDELELKLLSHYARLRRADGADFDMAAFARSYALLGAQRATKILGIFARLDQRDRKPQYLKHIPRIERYLAKNLAHPALSEVREWFQAHLPHIPASLDRKEADQ